MTMTRRQLILGLLGASATGLLPRARWARADQAPDKSDLTPEQRLTLEAAAQRILPGSREAGFAAYLATWIGREPFVKARDWLPLLRIGSVHLDRIARERYEKGFAAASAEQQDSVLRDFQGGKVKAKNFPAPAFFQRLVLVTLESFLSEPRYGGNRGEVGWHFIGRHPCWWAPKRVRRILDPEQGFHD